MNFAVDVISDVICPWCYIGKRRLEKAIAASARRCFIPCCGCAETVPDVQGHLSG
ncbi:MAG: DsbA family protein [Planctomycetales bacterium]|nr:DsbA family protein [Planctomycetales bacterium]